MKVELKVGTRVTGKATKASFIITAIGGDTIELKVDENYLSGLILTKEELLSDYDPVVDPFESCFLS